MARPKKGVTFYDRVQEHTVINADTGCWEFLGHRDECGYGRIHRDGKLVRVHRATFEDRNGPLPEGIEACHSCDNPPCWNPGHLYAGTHTQNMGDMIKRRRRRELRGSEKPTAKLTEQKVAEIKARLQNGEQCSVLGREYGVTECAIGFIKRGRTWSHVGASS